MPPPFRELPFWCEAGGQTAKSPPVVLWGLAWCLPNKISRSRRNISRSRNRFYTCPFFGKIVREPGMPVTARAEVPPSRPSPIFSKWGKVAKPEGGANAGGTTSRPSSCTGGAVILFRSRTDDHRPKLLGRSRFHCLSSTVYRRTQEVLPC
jgi:hypothetical protein